MPGIGARIREKIKTPLFKYQIQGVRKIEKNGGRFGLFDDMGVGKTIQAIAWMAINPQEGPFLIVSPSIQKLGWKEQFEEHSYLECQVLEGTKPYPIDPKIPTVINYDILQSWLPALIKYNYKCFFLDECQYIKNRKAKRTKAVLRLCKNRKVTAISGTPIESKPVEFFPALHLINPKEFPSFIQYAMRYCKPRRGFGGYWAYDGATNIEELNKRIEPFTIRRKYAEIAPTLPDFNGADTVRRIPILVELDNRKEYKTAETDFLKWMRDSFGRAASTRASKAEALVKMQKLKFVAAKGKLKKIINWIDDFLSSNPNKKLVVFGTHKEILRYLKEYYICRCFIDGSVSAKDRQKAKNIFQTDKKERLFISNIKAGGVAITLTAAHTVLFIELGAWNPSDYEQAERRVLRVGQKAKEVLAYYILAVNTVEVEIMEAVNRKLSICSQILDGEETENNFDMMLSILERRKNAI